MDANTTKQYREAEGWTALLCEAGYAVELHDTGKAEPFNWEWRVWGPACNGPQVATIKVDGGGVSWHGPEELWLRVIGSQFGVTG